MDYPNDSESYYLHLLDNLRHQDVPALQFANLVFRFCDGKFPFTEEHLSKLATLATEKLISESPLKEILLIFDTDEFREQLIKHQFTYDRFFVFCRYLCRSDKQGFDILAYAFFVKPWEKNPYFQLGFIKYCIDTCNVEEILSKCSPERYPIVPQIELLKSQPDFEKDKSLTSWKYVCSYRIVASLSENISFQSFCEDMLFQPLNKCPDLLVLGLFEVIDPLQQQQPPKQIPKLVELFLRKAVNRFIDPTQPNPSQPNATQIFQRLWPSDFSQAATPATLNWSQRLLIQVMLECYSNAPLGENQATKLKQILDLSQDLKALNVLLSTNSYVFVIDLACLVSRREYLKLDKWLNDKIAKNGQPFVDASIHFLRTRCTFFGARDFSNNGYPIEIFRLILESLKQSINFDEPKTPRELEIVKMYKAFIHLQMPGGNGSGSLKGSQFETAYNQQIMQTGQGQGGSRAVTTSAPLPPPVSMDNFHSFVPDADVNFPKEVEDEADSYFQKIYNNDEKNSMTIDEVLTMLAQFKDSPKNKERDIFRCMIRNLFKEFPFLAQYPAKELMITGELFGGIIANDYLKCFPLIGALRMMLDAIKKPPNPRMFNFATTALDRFRNRLKEFPQFCQHILTAPPFDELPPELARYIEYGQYSNDPPDENAIPNGVVPEAPATPTAKKNAPSISKDLGPLAEVAPPNAFQDKISFIINNLSQMNLSKKSEEFKELISKEKELYRIWVAHYLVMKRVSIEANFHQLYSTFLVHSLDMPSLVDLVLDETYRNIRNLLRNYRDSDNINDRTVLKNLGHWLGLITLQENRPILSSRLDLHGLLVEAYIKGLMHLYFVVPFVAKVLNGVSKSKVFRPPNPWTVSLLAMLVELHGIEDVKLNLKFEVEVLCKYLDIELDHYQGKVFNRWLERKELPKAYEPMLGNVINVSQIGAPSATPVSASSLDATSPLTVESISAPSTPAPVASSAVAIPNGGAMVHAAPLPVVLASTSAKLYNYNDVNANYMQRMLSLPTHLSDTIKDSIKKFLFTLVTEFAPTIVDKVLKVTFNTVEAVTKKDFQNEGSGLMLRTATQNMLRTLVGGYALILAKEPLHNRLASQLLLHLKNQLRPTPEQMRDVETLTASIITENIELCTCLVQKLCIERSLLVYDSRLKQDGEQRPEAIESTLARSNKNMAIYHELGRTVPGFVNVSPMHMFPGGAYPQPMSMPMRLAVSAPPPVVAPLPAAPMLPEGPLARVATAPVSAPAEFVPPPFDDVAMVFERLSKHLNDLVSDLEIDLEHPLMLDVRSIVDLMKNMKISPRDGNFGLSLIKLCVKGLRELINNFHESALDLNVVARVRDFYLGLLKLLNEQRSLPNRFTTTHVTRCVIEQWFASNQVSFPDTLFDSLVRAGLINFQYMDTEFSNLIENGNSASFLPVMFAFLKVYLGTPLLQPTQFQQTLELLNRINTRVNSNNNANSNPAILSDLRFICNFAQGPENDLNAFIEKVKMIIGEWIQCCSSGKNLNVSFQMLMKHMSLQGLLKNDESISRFFKIFLELVIENVNTIFAMASQHSQVTRNEVHYRCYEYIDSFTQLTLYFVKHSGSNTSYEQKFQFVQRIMVILSSTCIAKHDAHAQHGKDFQPLVYYRILMYIMVEFFYSPYHLGLNEPVIRPDTPPSPTTSHNLMQIESFKLSLLKSYAQLLHLLSPLKAPAFAFAWYDFVAHRVFISKMLGESTKPWELYFMILCDMLAFQKALLATDAKNDFYKVTVKLFVVLYHDFPDFLIEYCYHFCTLLPHRAINLRNIILSAVPMNNILPDPVKVPIKLEALPEILLPFRNMPTISELPFRKELENYLTNRQPSGFLNDLRNLLTCEKGATAGGDKAAGDKSVVVYNVTLLDTMTLHIGLSAIQNLNQITVASVANTSYIEVFQGLFMTFDSAGRYHLINSLVDHLRYPNTETLFYLCTILSLFNDSTDQLREQIVRVLLERILARAPHPWGVRYLLAELVRNPSYKLLGHHFVKDVPEVEKMLLNNFQEAVNPNFEVL